LIKNHKQVPFFGGAEETRQFNGLLSKYIIERDSGQRNELCEEVDKPIHLGTTSYSATETLIGFASRFLFLPLSSPCLPVMGDRFGGSIVYF